MADDKLMVEYQRCLDGYNYRDRMVHDIFSKLVQMFFWFLTLMLTLGFLDKASVCLYVCIQLILGVSCFLCLFSHLIKLEANSSCKKALRERCVEIEKTLDAFEDQYWHIISIRKKFLFEKLVKGRFNELVETSS